MRFYCRLDGFTAARTLFDFGTESSRSFLNSDLELLFGHTRPFDRYCDILDYSINYKKYNTRHT